MRTKALAIVLAFIVLLMAVSCSKDDVSVSNIQAQPYIRQNGQMGLSLYVMADAKDPEAMQMTVRDPSSNLSWSFNARLGEYDGSDYYGSSDISMPTGAMLPKGTWSLEIHFKDGATRIMTFEVSYSDEKGAIERFNAEKGIDPWFDSASNLTVLP